MAAVYLYPAKCIENGGGRNARSSISVRVEMAPRLFAKTRPSLAMRTSTSCGRGSVICIAKTKAWSPRSCSRSSTPTTAGLPAPVGDALERLHRLPKVATLLGEIEADLSSSSYLTQSLDRCGLYLFRTLNYE